jgi:hypothetical protein
VERMHIIGLYMIVTVFVWLLISLNKIEFLAPADRKGLPLHNKFAAHDTGNEKTAMDLVAS